MIITGVDLFVVDAFRANFVFLVIRTDAGVDGLGEATVEFWEQSVEAASRKMGEQLIGRNPFEIERIVEEFNRDSYWRSGPMIRSALSAIDMALLDIKGKALGVPAYELLGGAQRDRIRAYANGWYVGAKTPQEFGVKAAATAATGFQGLKWDPFGTAYLTLGRGARTFALDCIAAVRDAVGPDVALMIEGHGRFDVPTAIGIARDLRQFDPEWFEEPIPPENIDALAQVRRKSPVPISAGERYFDLPRFAELIRKEAVDILQPDVCHVGGLHVAKAIAAMAHAHYLPIAPHNPQGPVGNAASLALAAACPNFTWLETMLTDVPWRRDIVDEDLSMVDGEMLIPAKPGLGLTLAEEACGRHPYKSYSLRHYNGSLTAIRPADAVPFFRMSRTGQSGAP